MVRKKTATATAPKKAVAKKIKIEHAARPLVYANDPESFWVVNGKILNSLLSLREALVHMDKDTYSHHVNAQRNDFADWVAVVLSDSACAADLRRAKTAASAGTVVSRHLAHYLLP